MKKCCIFDLDGTLVNSIDDLADSCNYILSQDGLPVFETSEIKNFVGDGVYKLIERVLPLEMRDEDTVMKYKSRFDKHYRDNCFKKTKLYDGIEQLLKHLKKHGYILAVLSNKTDEFTKIIVDEFFDDGTFDYVLGKKENLLAKPQPDGIYEIIRNINVEKENVVLIGDSDVDIYTGEAADITTIGVLWGFRGTTELLNAGAEFIAENPEEAFEILQEINRQ